MSRDRAQKNKLTTLQATITLGIESGEAGERVGKGLARLESLEAERRRLRPPGS